ncbi:RNA polymerase sigma factor RpoE [Planctomycetes bacterium Pan216]|uniref:RNA polymerase sigma factor RpoE n=1 Tax=Kolteria novifilia TaxID=2527975 RepID=A0A518BBB7_9BACT|nr:RNA polymerase sigma factor RpoE [Planctomycetes bacterium Pan216]
MTDTSETLLDRLKHEPDSASWKELVEIYNPMIERWLNRHGLREADCDDVAQEVLLVVVRKLGGFEREPRTGAFRRWLRNITVNCLRDYRRSKRYQPLATGSSDFDEMLQQLADDDSELSRQWNLEHDRHVTRFLLERIKGGFTESTWLAFERVALQGQPAERVAQELGLSVNAVFIAKSRILSRLRTEGAGMLD